METEVSLATLLSDHNMTQAQLAKEINKTQGAISQWINKRSVPRLETMAEIATVMGCDLSVIVDCFRRH